MPQTQVQSSDTVSTVEAPVTMAAHSGAGEVIIQTRDLKQNYRRLRSNGGKTALHGLTIDVKRGEIFGLVGPNGSGKTTTLKLCWV
jgi:ABC-2 type transport system ATP-binding protein